MNYEMEDLIPIVAKLTERYTAGQSSSVSYEKAEQFMEAVLYCIHECESSERNTLMTANEISAAEAYEAGYQQTQIKVKKALALFHKLSDFFDAYENRCLQDTVMKGMPEFFKWYNVRFAPQNIILTLDYPVLPDLTEYSGIDAIDRYLRCVYYEQLFLRGMSREYVLRSLYQYGRGYRGMVENLCQIVCMELLCHILLGHAFETVEFTEEDTKRLDKMLRNQTTEELRCHLGALVKQLVAEKYRGSQRLEQCLRMTLEDIAVSLKNGCYHQFGRI